MDLQKSLTKEDFNEMMEKYPNAMSYFCAFIDRYKKEVDWEHVFFTHNRPTKKLYDLPHAMQLGIWLAYINQQGSFCYEIDIIGFDLREDMEEYFKARN